MPPDLFLGKSIHDILPHPLNKITAENIERALLSKAVQIYEYSIDIKGKRRHYESRMTAIDDDSVLTIIRDITIRKAAEEALRESENRFRVVFMTSPDSISISSPDDGTIVDVNESFATLSGYRRDEVIGRSALNLDIWNDPADREKMIRQMQTDGKVDNFEAIFRVKNNQLRTALLSARIIRLQGRDYMLLVARDVEDLKRAERALRESEERFRTIIETASDPIYVKNRQLHYITVNPSFARLFNLAPEYFAGKSYDDLFPDNDTEHNRKIEQRVLNGEIVAEESMRIIAGKEQYFHIISAPMRTAAGDIIGICGIARDITEIRNLREYAARAQRLETAGRIAGQVAHDFNNLLGPLIAYPGVIRDELPDNHEVISFLDDMEKAAEQMADINQQLLTLGRRGHYIQEPLNLNEIIRQVSELLQPYPEGVTLTTDLPDTIMNILGGSAQIYRIISNLAINAFDAMPGGGELHIATENCYVDEQVGEFRRIPIGEYVRITVSDTGHGIAEENLSMIFDPFFTTKKADRKRGSGLGLSVVHAVVEDHHGYIDVESRPGKGTIFRLYFPITRDKIDQAEAESIVGGDENIMVIDDDKIQRDVTLKLLEKLGYGAVGADGGEKALAILKTAPQDLLILDMIMPGMDGLETYRRVLEINRRQRAILVSGYAESDRVKRAHKLGAGEFLRKPITLKALATTIRKELDRE